MIFIIYLNYKVMRIHHLYLFYFKCGDFMPCFHPLKAFALRKDDGSYFPPVFTLPDEKHYHLYDKLKLPCGQCLGCRLEYSRQWMMRCSLEALDYPHSSYFITLTYDDLHLPINEFTVVDKLTGELGALNYVPTLAPKDLTLFFKRLRIHWQRKYDHVGIRFYACGEYGCLNGRPHYHLSIFNLPLTDLVRCGKLKSGYYEFHSKELEAIWGKGIVSVSPFSPATAGYVARYMLKKHKGQDSDFYKLNGIEPEFSRCSRKPGIGAKYFHEHGERVYQFDQIFINSLPLKPPKYFDRLYDEIDHELLAQIKARRKALAESAPAPDNSVHNPEFFEDDPYLDVLESYQNARIRALPRCDI